MKIITNFKSEIVKNGKILSSQIIYTESGVQKTLTNDSLFSIKPSFNTDILKSCMKQLDFESPTKVPKGTIVKYKLGVYVKSMASFEYIDYGNYIVSKEPEYNADTFSYSHVCYDKMLYSMKNYESLGITYPITVRNYLNAICDKLGITFGSSDANFANYDKEITNELYLDASGKNLGYTFRDILDEIAQVTASTILIDENDNLVVKYITETSDIIDEDYLKDVNVTMGKKYGPVNSIVLSRSADSDNVYLKDDTNIATNGLCEIKISDNQIMNGNNRSDYLNDILNKLNGLEYYLNDFSSIGICYYEPCDRYTISIGEMNYSCVMFNDEIQVTQGLQENIFTKLPSESETDYKKADKTDRKINQTILEVNKQKGEINALVSQLNDLENMTDTKTGNPVITNNAIENPLYKLVITGDGEIEDAKLKVYSKNVKNNYPIAPMTKDSNTGKYYLDGVSTQETRSGKNLFNLTGVSNTTIGSLLDGIVTLNWSGGYDCFILNNSSQYTALDSTKTYTLSFKHKGNKIYLKDYNNSSNYVLTNNDSDYVSYSFTFTSVSSMRLDANRSDTTGTAYIKDFQLEVGSAKTDYEEYGAMPTPDNPSEIVNLYQAGTYQATIDNKVYTFTLADDLRSAGSIADRLWLDTTSLTFEVVKNVGTKTLDGSESYSLYSSNSVRTILSTNISDIASYTSSSSIPMLMSNYYKPASQSATWKCGDISRITGVALIYLVQTNGYTVASFQTWLGTHNTLVHYGLATSTSTSGTITPIYEEYNLGINSLYTLDDIKDEYIMLNGNAQLIKRINVDESNNKYILDNPVITDLGNIYISLLPGINTLEFETGFNMVATYFIDNELTRTFNSQISSSAQLKLTSDNIIAKTEQYTNGQINSVTGTISSQGVAIDVLTQKTSKIDDNGNTTSFKTTGYLLNSDGFQINTSEDGFNALHNNVGSYYKDGDTVLSQTTKDGILNKDLELYGAHKYGKDDIDDTPMFIAQLYTDSNNEVAYGHFFNGGDA